MAGSDLRYDVAVIGGGIVGLGFAIWLREQRPQTSIVVLERQLSPSFKIGESLTSTTTQYLRELGLTDQVMRALCRSKFGQAFWWTGYGSADVAHHLSSRVGETYHVERRPVEIALARRAERLGIEVRRGVTVRVDQLGTNGNVLSCERVTGDKFSTHARIVCDASGPAAAIPRTLGYHRPGPLTGFNCTAYYGYFRVNPEAMTDITHWTIDATSHVCFPQGWMWVIALTSWERSPDGQLAALADYLLDHRDAPETQLPSRVRLADKFGCPYDEIVSIGFTVRDDDDTARSLPADQRFTHYVDRYPGLAHVMRGFQLVRPYGERPYKQRRHMAYHCARASGDGWVAVGDSTVLINPLFSPGMKDGLKQAQAAARLVRDGLDQDRADREFFAPYERTVNALASIAFRETEMLYRGFRHAATYERTMSLRLLIGALIILRLGKLPIPPPAWEPIWTRYVTTLDQVLAVEQQAETGAWPEQEWVAALESVIDPFIAWMREQEIVRQAQIGNIVNRFTDDLRPRPGGLQDHPAQSLPCPGCTIVAPATLTRCPRCGHGIASAELAVHSNVSAG